MKHACVGLLSTNTFWPQRHERLPETPWDSSSVPSRAVVPFPLVALGPYLWQERAPLDRDKTFVIYFYWLWCGPHRCPRRGQLTGRQWIRLALHTHVQTHTHRHRERERLLHTHNPGYKLRLLNLIEQRHTVTELQPVHCCSRCCLPHCLQFWAFRKRPKKNKPQQACLRGAWAWALRARRNLQKRPKVKSELMSTKWSHL